VFFDLYSNSLPEVRGYFDSKLEKGKDDIGKGNLEVLIRKNLVGSEYDVLPEDEEGRNELWGKRQAAKRLKLEKLQSLDLIK